MPFLRGTTPIWSTQDLPRRFKEWKACFVEIGQRAHKLETDARDNFPKVENLAYQCMEKGGAVSLWLSGTILRQIQAPR